MAISDFRVEPADFRVDFEALQSIRKTVLIAELHQSNDLAFDNLDSECFHFIARDNFHHPIGCARLSPDQTLSGMAVLTQWRGKGVGKALINAVLAKCRHLGWTELRLTAHPDVLGFYEALGFTRNGEALNDNQIPRQPMRLSVEPIHSISRPAPKLRDSEVAFTPLTGIDDNLTAMLTVISRARRKLYIYSKDLEAPLYGHPQIVEALKKFAIHSGGGEVNILFQDTIALRGHSHPLIDLSQRLSSIFMIRTPIEAEDLQYPSTFLINDRESYLFRPQSSHYAGGWSPISATRNRQLTEEFDRVWQRSRICTEFKALSL